MEEIKEEEVLPPQGNNGCIGHSLSSQPEELDKKYQQLEEKRKRDKFLAESNYNQRCKNSAKNEIGHRQSLSTLESLNMRNLHSSCLPSKEADCGLNRSVAYPMPIQPRKTSTKFITTPNRYQPYDPILPRFMSSQFKRKEYYPTQSNNASFSELQYSSGGSNKKMNNSRSIHNDLLNSSNKKSDHHFKNSHERFSQLSFMDPYSELANSHERINKRKNQPIEKSVEYKINLDEVLLYS